MPSELVNTSILFGVLGLATGMIWANYTWGAPWSGDPKPKCFCHRYADLLCLHPF